MLISLKMRPPGLLTLEPCRLRQIVWKLRTFETLNEKKHCGNAAFVRSVISDKSLFVIREGDMEGTGHSEVLLKWTDSTSANDRCFVSPSSIDPGHRDSSIVGRNML